MVSFLQITMKGSFIHSSKDKCDKMSKNRQKSVESKDTGLTDSERPITSILRTPRDATKPVKLLGITIEGMGHEDRIEFGKGYAKRLLEKHGENLVYFGIGGSTFKNNDRKDSDIDGILVSESRKGWPSKWPEHIVRGITIGVAYYTVDELNDIMAVPNYMWPYRAYRVTNSIPFYQKYDLIGKYKETIRNIDPQKFVEAYAQQITIAFSSLGKIKYNASMGDLAAVRSSATETFAEFLDSTVALLNKELLPTGGYGFRNLRHIAQFKDLPKDYVRLSTIIWESSKPEEIERASTKLLVNTFDFAKRYGVVIPNLKSVSEVPV